jgi:hypothetical protein
MQAVGAGIGRYNELKAIYAAKIDRETKSIAVVNLNEGKAASADEAIMMAEKAQGGKSFKDFLDAAAKR